MKKYWITDESNRYGDMFAIRSFQPYGPPASWPMVAWSRSRIEAECYVEGTLQGKVLAPNRAMTMRPASWERATPN